MKSKKEYIILGLVIIALALFVIYRNTDRHMYQLPDVPAVKGDTLTKIQIQKPDAEITLIKKDNRWFLSPQGFLADKDRVKGLLDIIENLSLTALISESKKYERYLLDPANKIRVTAWSGDTRQREFEIGKSVAVSRHTFVRLPDDDRVYHAQVSFRNRFEKTVDALRDKTVLTFEPNEIGEIRITAGKKTTTLTRPVPGPPSDESAEKSADAATPEGKDIVWTDAAGIPADPSKIKSLLNTLSSLTCETYIDEKQKDDLNQPIYEVNLKGTKTYTLSISAKSDKDAEAYPAISSENDDPFHLPGWQVENIMIKPEDLMVRAEKK